MRRLADLAVISFALVLIPWGLSGMFMTSLWLETILHLPMQSLDPGVRATFSSEFRFLEARELGVGLLALVFRHRIVTEKVANRVFLVVVAAAPVARTAAWLVDGAPVGMFRIFALVELSMLAVIALTTRHTAHG